jgi:hypothetical protein
MHFCASVSAAHTAIINLGVHITCAPTQGKQQRDTHHALGFCARGREIHVDAHLMIPRLITRPKDIRSKIAARTMGALVVGRRTLWYAYSGSHLVRVRAEHSRELLFVPQREMCVMDAKSDRQN